MEKYYINFDSKRKVKGEELYKNNYVKYVVKYNNSYYSKVIGNNENFYYISIDNNNVCCDCYDDTFCKHIYASLLSINENKYTTINLNELSKANLLELINFCITKDKNIFNNIEKFITRQIQNISIKEIEHFFENFELEDFNLLINDYNYEYDENIYSDDDELIKILKNINYDNTINKKEQIHNYVKQKLIHYNNNYEDIDINMFQETLKYLKNPDNYFTNNDIITLFENNYEKAIIEFEKIDNFKSILYIYNNIQNDNKLNILLNKVEKYIDKNQYDYNLLECIIIIIEDSIDEQIIKKYGLIVIDKLPKYYIFVKIKSLCNDNELELIFNNIIKSNILNKEKFNILYDYKRYDSIYELLYKENNRNYSDIIYYEKLIHEIPDKIIKLLKINIENILNNGDSYNYHYVIEFLKLFKNNNPVYIFVEYINNLLIIYKRKIKFKNLLNSEFGKDITTFTPLGKK